MRKTLTLVAFVLVNNVAAAAPAQAGWENSFCKPSDSSSQVLPCCPYCLFWGCDC